MKKTEYILSGLILLGMSMKPFRLPGSSLLLILGISLLSSIYFTFSFALFNRIRFRHLLRRGTFQYADTSRLIGAQVIGCGMAIVLIGILFKVQLWPGAPMILIAGLFYLSLCVIAGVALHFVHRTPYHRRLLKRVAIVGAFGLMLLALPSTALVDLYYRDDPELRDVYRRYLEHPQDEAIQMELHELRTGRESSGDQ